ncbi:MAG: MFS transporter [Actinomycetia bacterium]|nr:MFS transporter [Actinomycetes bacterium]MCP4961439.1 MFS transporter [Actinomycetes bacterium]
MSEEDVGVGEEPEYPDYPEELIEGFDDLISDTDLSAWEAAELAAHAVDPDVVLGGPAFAEASTVAKTWALFLGVALLMTGNGLQGAVLAIRADAEGFGVGVTGLIMTTYFLGFLVGSRYAEHALQSVGHIRVFAALASAASSAALIHVVWVTPVLWAIMRFVFGLCMAGLYVVIESWLNDLGTNKTRGRLLGSYMVVTMGSIAAGQFLLNVADPKTFTLFALASILVSLSLVPVTLSAASSPPLSEPARLSLRDLARMAPSGLAVGFLSGSSLGALIGLGAVYVATTDLGGAELSLWLSAPVMGSVVSQWPIGWISDRIPRRGVIFAAAAIAAGCGVVLLVIDASSYLGIAVMALLGAVAFPLYSLAIAITQDWIAPEHIVGASAALVRVNGAGAIVGPLAAAGLMAIDIELYFVAQILPYLAICLFIAWRIAFVEAVPVDEQGPYQAFPARASARAALLLQRSVRRTSKARVDTVSQKESPS